MTKDELSLAAQILGRGGLVAHACEGVWGLACDPWCEDAIARIFKVKKRIASKGLIVIGHDADVFLPEIEELSAQQEREVRDSWPGHITWIVPTARFPKSVTGGRSTIAVRVPCHEQARSLCARFGGPLISTSANVSSEPPARTEMEVRKTVGSLVDFVLPGSIGSAVGPSQIRDAVTNERLR